MVVQCSLQVDGDCERFHWCREHKKERVALGGHDGVNSDVPEELVVLIEQRAVLVATERLKQPRRSLDVGEQEGHVSHWEVALGHGRKLTGSHWESPCGYVERVVIDSVHRCASPTVESQGRRPYCRKGPRWTTT